MVFPTEPCKNDPQFPYYAVIAVVVVALARVMPIICTCVYIM